MTNCARIAQFKLFSEVKFSFSHGDPESCLGLQKLYVEVHLFGQMDFECLVKKILIILLVITVKS